MVEEYPIKGDKRLLELWRQDPASRRGRRAKAHAPLGRLRYPLVRLAEDWARYRLFAWQPEVSCLRQYRRYRWTNNATERATGRMKTCQLGR